MTTPLKTPIAFIIFNRPQCTRKVFERIREMQPEKLYLIADGPRANKPGEDERCQETRDTVEQMIDWPCELHKIYAEKNMGCGRRLPSGLTQMFSEVDRAIILEDDIIPDPSFFPFCETMLERYADTAEIMQIGAYNRFQYAPEKNSDYFYSRFSDIWGWATWKRAWDKFNDFDPAAWEAIRGNDSFRKQCFSSREEEMRSFCLDQIFSGELSAWGMRWDTTKMLHHGLGIVPSKNLALNIGFGSEASHTINPLNPHRFIKVHSITPPYTSPDKLRSDPGYDHKYNRKMFPNHVLTEKIRSGILKILGKK